jgi:hypothetical protein
MCVCARARLSVCICERAYIRYFNNKISSHPWNLFSDTDVCCKDWNYRNGSKSWTRENKDVFYTESTEKEESLWTTETANVSTWNVIAGPLATPTPCHPASNFTRSIPSTGISEVGKERDAQ